MILQTRSKWFYYKSREKKMIDTKTLVSYLAIRLSFYYQEHLLTLPGKHWDSRVSIYDNVIPKMVGWANKPVKGLLKNLKIVSTTCLIWSVNILKGTLKQDLVGADSRSRTAHVIISRDRNQTSTWSKSQTLLSWTT